MRVTITTLARQLGVAPSTVSRAFSHPHLLRPGTVERIRAAAAAVGYVPNQHARALTTGRSRAVGVIVSDITNPFFPPIIRALQREAQRADCTVVLGDTAEEPQREVTLARHLSSQVDGLLLISPRSPDSVLRQLHSQQRVVLVNRDTLGTARLLVDTKRAIMEAVVLAAAQGHVQLAYINGRARSWSNRQRRRHVAVAAADCRLAFTEFDAPTGSFEEAESLAPSILESGSTLVIAFDDLVGHGVLVGLAKKGVGVPEHVSVIGFDDVLGSITYPALTSIHADLDSIGATAARLLIEPRSGPEPPRRIVIESRLTVRESLGPCGSGSSVIRR